MKQTLWDISEDMQALDDLLFECGGDMEAPEVEKIICEWAEDIQHDFSDKVDNYAALIKMMEARSKARKEEAARLSDRARVDANNAKSLKERLKFIFEKMGTKKIETDRFVVGIAKNGGKQALEVLPEPEELPSEYRNSIVVYSADKEAIREAIAEGEEISGCKLLPRGTSLRIK